MKLTNIYLSSKLSLTYMGSMLTIIKVFIILFLLCLWEQETSWQFSKHINKIIIQNEFQDLFFFLPKLKGKKGLFWKGARRGTTFWDYLQEHLFHIRDEKVSPFVKLEIILPLLCFLFDPLTNKHTAGYASSIINLWIDSRTCQK